MLFHISAFKFGQMKTINVNVMHSIHDIIKQSGSDLDCPDSSSSQWNGGFVSMHTITVLRYINPTPSPLSAYLDIHLYAICDVINFVV
jgi:hypothetical protein